MRKLKKGIKYFGVLGILIILFRGFIYRTCVNYTQVKTKTNITLTNKKLINEINIKIDNTVLDIEKIIELSNQITSEKLNFTFNKVSSNPNLVTNFNEANCIGYSALFNSIGNYILRHQKLTDRYEFIHLVAELDFLEINLHTIIDNPFFKNHDFNEIKHKKTGEKKFVDPSLRDYLRINYVTSK